jgi:hypothetical protein
MSLFFLGESTTVGGEANVLLLTVNGASVWYWEALK